MMKNTIYLVLLSLALATNASAERHLLCLRRTNKNSDDRDVNNNISSQGLTPSLSTEREFVDAAIQKVMQYEEEVLELAETLKTRAAGIKMTAPHHLEAIESANEYLETRAEGISKTGLA
jgi:hypothetical protein